MSYNLLADLVVILHVLFVLFVLFGGFLALWKPGFAWLHIPAFLWGAAIEFTGWICPLTPLENLLRARGGAGGYETGFVEHYIIPVLYPTELTRQMQVILGITVLCLNGGIYLFLLRRTRKK